MLVEVFVFNFDARGVLFVRLLLLEQPDSEGDQVLVLLPSTEELDSQFADDEGIYFYPFVLHVINKFAGAYPLVFEDILL